MDELRCDEEATKSLLAIHVTPDLTEQRRQFLRALSPQKGEKVLDLGSGPGFLAAEIAVMAASAGSVQSIDVSKPTAVW